MKKIALILAVLMAVAGAANAVTVTYGWEDGVGTILGSYGNLVNPTNVGSPVNSGSRALSVTESPHSSTPQAYLAYVEGLTDGDVVDASFFGFDDTPDLSPSLRIWAHYANSGDVNSYAGSAGGNNTYTSGIGWEEISWNWVFDSDGGTRDALVIEARLYSYPTSGEYSTEYFIDDLTVTSTAGTITVPVPEPASMAILALGGLVLRRRK